MIDFHVEKKEFEIQLGFSSKIDAVVTGLLQKKGRAILCVDRFLSHNTFSRRHLPTSVQAQNSWYLLLGGYFDPGLPFHLCQNFKHLGPYR
jgi:hypothetical protein